MRILGWLPAGISGMLLARLCAGLCALFLAVLPAQAADEDVITLGAAISLTGKYSTNGMNTRDGYMLAAERVNAAGGVKVGDKHYRLEVVFYDDESTPARAAQLAERLIRQDRVQFLLGPYSSGLTKAMAPVTEKYAVPMVEGNGASISLFDKGYRYQFAVLSTSDQYLKSAITLAAEQAQRDGRDPASLRLAGVFENDPFSQDIRDGLMQDAAQYGMRFVIDDKLPPELNDIATSLIKVKALKPDMLIISGHSKGAALAVRQLAEMRVDVPMVAMTHCDSAQIIEKFGKDAEYMLCASQWAATLSYSDRWFGSAGEFAALFEKTYDYAPPYQAAESAASVLVYADALTRAGRIDPEAVRDALAETDIETFFGKVKFNAAGVNIAKPMVLFQVQDGEYVVVAPSQWAAGSLRHPIPLWSDR